MAVTNKQNKKETEKAREGRGEKGERQRQRFMVTDQDLDEGKEEKKRDRSRCV